MLEEIGNKYAEEFKKVIKEASRLGLHFGTIFNYPETPENGKDARKVYTAHVRTILSQYDTHYLDYPAIPHNELVQRALKRRKPFAEHKGYRDALIWESVLELAKQDEDDLVFISTNYKDFGVNKSSEQLHPHLLEDLQNKGFPKGKVSYYQSLSAYFDKMIRPTLTTLEQLQSSIADDTYQHFSLTTFLERLGLDFQTNLEFSPEEVGFPQEFESPHISAVEEIKTIDNIDVRLLSTEQILISFSADVTCSFDVFIHKSDAHIHLNDGNFDVWDWDWNRHYVVANAYNDVRIFPEIIFDTNELIYISAQIASIEPLDDVQLW